MNDKQESIALLEKKNEVKNEGKPERKTSVADVSGDYSADINSFGRATSIISSSDKVENDEVGMHNIWSYTLINVASSTIALVAIFFIETINLSFVGHTKNAAINLEAVGIGNILLNFTSLFLVFGALGGLDTVGSFCFGKKDYLNVGIYTIRMRIIIITCFFILTVPCCLYCTNILKSLGIDTEVAERSGHYTFNMIPSIFFIFNFNLNVRYLQVMHDYFFVSTIAVISVILHFFTNYIAFKYWECSFVFVAYSSNISTFIAFLLSSIYIIFYNPHKETLIFYHPDVLNYREFMYFIKLSAYSSLQHYGDFIGYEAVTFMGVYLPVAIENSASLVLLNYTTITGYLYGSSGYPLGQLVGYCMGKMDEVFYKQIIIVYAKLNLIIGSVLTLFTIVFADEILGFYTRQTEIQDIAYPIMILYAFFALVDNFNIMFQSILRGSGNQYIPSFWNMISTVFITIPVAYILTFVFNFGVLGLWIGMFTFMTFMLCLSFFYVYKLDFKQNAEKIKKEIEGDSQLP